MASTILTRTGSENASHKVSPYGGWSPLFDDRLTRGGAPNSQEHKENIMSPTHQKRRIAAATVLAASAMVAGALGTAAPANAADTYVALAYQFDPPVSAVGKGATSDAARVAALGNCNARNCEVYINVQGTCAALAVNVVGGTNHWETGTGFPVQTAEQQALQGVPPGGHIAASGCPALKPWQQRPTISPLPTENAPPE